MKARFGWLVAAGWLFAATQLRAHIGSPAVVFEGAAGPYPIRVIIQPALVVPGRAAINVRLLQDDTGPVKVTVLPVNWRVGLNGAPAPDEAQPVKGEPSLRHTELWLMTSGSYSVHVMVSGSRGSGTAIVPVVSVATQRLTMSPWLGVVLGVLGLTLYFGAATLVATGVRDSVAGDDSARTSGQKRRGVIFFGFALVVFGGGIYAGKRWWDAEDRNYRTNLIYHARPLTASVRERRGQATIVLDSPPETDRPSNLFLIPDHGKLMHLFMIREPQLDALAHLHPMRAGPHTFAVLAPPLPAGKYRLYADITNETGFASTLVTTVDLPAASDATSAASAARDPDDSWFVGAPGDAPNADTVLTWTGSKALRAGEDVALTFAAVDHAGHPVELEPYMGMLGHAAVRRSDGAVFAHLHPVGTISMAAQSFFANEAAKQSGVPAPEDHAMHAGHAMSGAPVSVISFPYLFPQPGTYRLWVQAKTQGRVITGVFDLDVAPAK